MVPRNRRLTKEGDFARVYRGGLRRRTASLLAWQLRTDSHKVSRYAVVVSSKAANKATMRNKMRRRIYASLRKYHNLVPLTGIDLVISVQKRATILPFQTLEQEVKELLTACRSKRA